MKRHNQPIPLKVGLKSGETVAVNAHEDYYTDSNGQRIEYDQVAWVSTDTEELEVRG